MKYIEYVERRRQGTFSFPIAYYHVTPRFPRYVMTYHWHHYYEIIHVKQGELRLTLNGVTTNCEKGDVVLVTGGVLHGGIPKSCIYDCIVFDFGMLLKENQSCAKIMADIIDQRVQIFPYLSRESATVVPIVERLCAALAGKLTGYEFVTQGFLYQLLGVILEEHLYKETAPNETAAQRLAVVTDVLDFIAVNYSGDISLSGLAKTAGMNPKYLCRYFKNVTGRTPIDYLNFYRIECACELLSTKDISIKEAAISCGFNDESYFIRTFRKYKGTTPRQFVRVRF